MRVGAGSNVGVMCQCGCGLPAPVAKQTMSRRGYVKGQPQRFIRGHVARTLGHRDSYHRTVVKGYVQVYVPSHERAGRNGFVAEHIMVAQQALGKPLPAGAEVHHVNRDRADNRPVNLVICQEAAYHRLLHYRARIKAAGGDPNTDRICSTCKRVLPLGQFYPKKTDITRECKACVRIRMGFKPWVSGGKGRPPVGAIL